MGRQSLTLNIYTTIEYNSMSMCALLSIFRLPGLIISHWIEDIDVGFDQR